MRRICKYCGKTYEGDSGSSACPDCVAERKKTTVRDRICRQCGKVFPGGPRAWHCPECRKVRSREQCARHRQTGTARPLGSVDKCESCGREYVVNSGRQRYCPQCAPEKYRETDREQSKAWNAANTTPEERKGERKAAKAEIPCAVCGKLFAPVGVANTCGPECRRQLAKRRAAKWEAANRAKRNAARREQNRNKKGTS